MDILKIALLSGKGGTGKTTIAASLAKVIPGSAYVDCDVEEPNGFLFLNPDLENNEQVFVPVPGSRCRFVLLVVVTAFESVSLMLWRLSEDK